MNNSTFYNHVSSWIKSYTTSAPIPYIKKYIKDSAASQEIKERLLLEADHKQALLNNAPFFAKMGDDMVLMNKRLHPEIYTTKYQARQQLTQLQVRGYDVELLPTGTFYKIKLLRYATPVELPIVEQSPLTITQ